MVIIEVVLPLQLPLSKFCLIGMHCEHDIFAVLFYRDRNMKVMLFKFQTVVLLILMTICMQPAIAGRNSKIRLNIKDFIAISNKIDNIELNVGATDRESAKSGGTYVCVYSSKDSYKVTLRSSNADDKKFRVKDQRGNYIEYTASWGTSYDDLLEVVLENGIETKESFIPDKTMDCPINRAYLSIMFPPNSFVYANSGTYADTLTITVRAE